jgi:hypothetical protein
MNYVIIDTAVEMYVYLKESRQYYLMILLVHEIQECKEKRFSSEY